jgi:hypothetical protein
MQVECKTYLADDKRDGTNHPQPALMFHVCGRFVCVVSCVSCVRVR